MTTINTERYDKEHFTYGGNVLLTDFNTTYENGYSSPERGSSIAARIENDIKWRKKLDKKRPDYSFKRKEDK